MMNDNESVKCFNLAHLLPKTWTSTPTCPQPDPSVRIGFQNKDAVTLQGSRSTLWANWMFACWYGKQRGGVGVASTSVKYALFMLFCQCSFWCVTSTIWHIICVVRVTYKQTTKFYKTKILYQSLEAVMFITPYDVKLPINNSVDCITHHGDKISQCWSCSA